MRAIAVDDEPMALAVIRAQAEKVPFVTLEATFASATEALAYLQQESVDLVFLDINMPHLNGLDFVRVLGRRLQLIFTTAHPEFAVQGFELAATDYLLKPIGFTRFLQACSRAQEALSRSADERNAGGQYLFVKDGYDWVRIDLAGLQYIEADDNYLTFHQAGRKVLTRMTLTEALRKLPESAFMRVHKSYIIALAAVEKIERHQLTVAGKDIPLSPPYRETLLRRLNG